MSDAWPLTEYGPETALMSERSLAKDWLNPEEDEARDYLQ